MMFKSTISALAIAAFASLVGAQNSTTAEKIGYTGTLSSLDGGLGGTVQVVDATTLQISSYTLKDASAPALYWWGTTDGVLKNGFRISNTQVTSAAKSNMLTIKLDSGKTTADFSTVGLWCERLNANFGQATLKASDGSSATTSSGPSSASTTAKSAAPIVGSSNLVIVSTFLVAVAFAAHMA
ncbi:hypothetical protein BGZ60DRAFT_521230 [Tricladium varicosporioides]|nr:hypothetical protein BGZ60DRAFT_521230 [Hymenoscyphus varicosporioides]